MTLVVVDNFAVVSDRRYLKQVLHNLLTNAEKHGTGPIRITLNKLTLGAVCRIENAGNAATATKQGNGLGLRIVRALAQSLGCKVETCDAGGQFASELQWERSA